jgi:hypothetical protein
MTKEQAPQRSAGLGLPRRTNEDTSPQAKMVAIPIDFVNLTLLEGKTAAMTEPIGQNWVRAMKKGEVVCLLCGHALKFEGPREAVIYGSYKVFDPGPGQPSDEARPAIRMSMSLCRECGSHFDSFEAACRRMADAVSTYFLTDGRSLGPIAEAPTQKQ